MKRRTAIKSIILLPMIGGVRGASAADDTTIVQSLIDIAWQSGGIVQLEARDYFISGVRLPEGATRPITLRGMGRGYSDYYWASKGGTRLIVSDPSVSAISYNGTTVRAYYPRPVIRIEDLSILGVPGVASSGHGIRINGGASVPIVLLRNVLVAWFGGCGVWLSNCENGSVENVHSERCRVGFHGDVAYNANAHLNLSAELCQTGILIENSESLSFTGGMAQSNDGSGLLLRNVTAAHFSAMHFENNNRLNQPDCWAALIEGGRGIGFDQCSFIYPRDKSMVRGGARSVRFVGGKNISATPAITIDPSVHGARIDECVAPGGVQGAARILWDGMVAGATARLLDEYAI